MKKILRHTRKHVLGGLLAIIPLALTFLALRLLYTTIDQRAVRLVYHYFGFSFPGLGILLVIIFLYLLGFVASNVIGRRMLGLIEKITERIPFVKTTYRVGKQLSNSFSTPGKQIFKRAVLVEFLRPGIWTIGFVTGSVVDRTGNDEKYLKVFVPTPPNPTSGTMVLVRESEIRDPGWTIEEALNTVLSGGIIGPQELRPSRGPS